MHETFQNSYYYLDLLIGYGSPLLFLVLYKTGLVKRFIWHFFWIGVLIGLTWEIPIFVLSAEFPSLPIVIWVRPFPVHYLVFMISHSLWDGLIFVIGIWLVYVTCRKPYFERFSWRELAVLMIWGQASELMVELSSTFNDGWTFIEYWWNPVMFHFNGHNVTCMMQIVWGIAPIVFYAALLKYNTTREQS